MKITTKDLESLPIDRDYFKKHFRNLLDNGKTLIEILDMKEIWKKVRLRIVIAHLTDEAICKFIIWCARQEVKKFIILDKIDRDNVNKIIDFIDIVEDYHINNNKSISYLIPEAKFEAESANCYLLDSEGCFQSEAYHLIYWIRGDKKDVYQNIDYCLFLGGIKEEYIEKLKEFCKEKSNLFVRESNEG